MVAATGCSYALRTMAFSLLIVIGVNGLCTDISSHTSNCNGKAMDVTWNLESLPVMAGARLPLTPACLPAYSQYS